MIHLAIHALYPEVVSVLIHLDGTKEIKDINGNDVEIDMGAVNAKVIEMKAEETTAIQTQADARQSALNKLMALGLTEEEALALGVK
jgi:hypothetical protein